jgi:hypothetical protein
MGCHSPRIVVTIRASHAELSGLPEDSESQKLHGGIRPKAPDCVLFAQIRFAIVTQFCNGRKRDLARFRLT